MPRPTILTQDALARIASLVDHGHSAAEIASEMGCTLGTLRVRCSQLGISLRRRAARSHGETMTAMDLVPSAEVNDVAGGKSIDRVDRFEQNPAVASVLSSEAPLELKVLLPQITVEQLRQRGALHGISGSTLASQLLVMLARDGLYDAVLDGG